MHRPYELLHLIFREERDKRDYLHFNLPSLFVDDEKDIIYHVVNCKQKMLVASKYSKCYAVFAF